MTETYLNPHCHRSIMKHYRIGSETLTFDEGWPEDELKAILTEETDSFYRSKVAEAIGEHGL